MLSQELGARRYLGPKERASRQGWLRRALICACPLSGGMQPQVGMPGAGPVPLERGQGKADVCNAVCGVSLAPVSSAVSQLPAAWLCQPRGCARVCALRHKAVVAAPWLPGLTQPVPPPIGSQLILCRVAQPCPGSQESCLSPPSGMCLCFPPVRARVCPCACVGRQSLLFSGPCPAPLLPGCWKQLVRLPRPPAPCPAEGAGSVLA